MATDDGTVLDRRSTAEVWIRLNPILYAELWRLLALMLHISHPDFEQDTVKRLMTAIAEQVGCELDLSGGVHST